MMRSNNSQTRRGAVLIVVLVVIALLALGAYSFSELMISESHGTAWFGKEVQARACADSGIELATAVLGPVSESGLAENTHHDPGRFGGVTIRDAASPRGRARFSLVAPNESDLAAGSIRFGLTDESSKLNLNSLINAEKKAQQQSVNSATTSGTTQTAGTGLSGTISTGTGSSGTSSSGTSPSGSTSGASSGTTASAASPQSRLLMIPGMDEELADAILDFLDDDESPRTSGCESDYYKSLTPAYSAKNGALESLDELLLVRGVTALLLYGEDWNRNGLLDPNENDGNTSWPPDNSDGILNLGWSAYLTVFGREKNLQFDGTPRVNINNNDLASLFDKLETNFDAATAQFVIAFRVNTQTQNQTGGGTPAAGASSQPSSGGKSGGTSGASPGSSGGSTSQIQQLQTAAKNLGNAVGGGGGTVTRGGIDLSKGATRQLTSIYELIGAEALATVNGTNQTLKSPWSENGSDMTSYLPALLDTISTSDDQFLDGRINVNQARRETLLSIPGMTESIADMIVSKRLGADGTPISDSSGSRATAGWLVAEGAVDLPTMIKLDPYVTARGGIYRVQSIGYFDEAGPFTRLEAVIDTTQSNKPPAVIFLQDLTELGRGFSPALLHSQ